nr:transcription elongation factor GreA [Photorhabdus antumapuensis]
MISYTNVPGTIATVISSGRATLHELDTVYGVEDLWQLIEIIQVDNHNAYVLQQGKN